MSETTTPKLSHNEVIKAAIPTLAGNIAATIADPAADRFSEDDQQFIKFHGIYQQDDRDLRKTAKKFQMMIRGRIPGGVMTAAQWVTFDDLATRYGNNTLRVTTRQSIQFHGVHMSGLGPLVKKINESLLSTLAACGDVNRNVTAPPTPAYTRVREQVYADSVRLADALAPRTKAYHSIWIEGVQLKLDDPANQDFTDPLYGRTYLPRKFKASFVIPPVNDMDIFTNDLGFIAVVEGDRLLGYNLAVGGGMGRSHGNVQTFPRLADVIGFFAPEHVIEVAKAVLTIHRDFGDRANRKHARLKSVVEERGTAWLRDEVNRRTGITLAPVRPYEFKTTGDLYGWHRAVDGTLFLTLFVETGRIKDVPGHAQKTALRQVAEKFPQVEFRLSANQNVIIAHVPETDRAAITSLLASHGVKVDQQASILHAASMACPSLPTCGLGLAESERVDADLGVLRVEDPQHDLFAPEGRQRVDAEVDGARLRELHLDAAVLRHAALGDVELGHDLESRGEPRAEIRWGFGDFAQDAVHAEAHAVRLLVRFEVDVRCAGLDGVEQHLVDESDDRRVVGGARHVRFVVVVLLEGLHVEVVEVGLAGIEERLFLLGEELIDEGRELVFLDQDRLGVHARVELDLVERLQVRRIGDGDEETHAALHERQRVVLADQLLLDDVLWNRLEIEGCEVEERYAEFLRSGGRDGACLGEVVVDEVGDERDAGLARVLGRPLRRVGVEHAVLHEPPRESGERNRLRCHRACNPCRRNVFLTANISPGRARKSNRPSPWVRYGHHNRGTADLRPIATRR